MNKDHLKLVVSNEITDPYHQEESQDADERSPMVRLLKGFFGVTLYFTWLGSLLVSFALFMMVLGAAPMDDRFSEGQIGVLAFFSLLIFVIGFVTKGKHPGVTHHGF